MVNYIDCNSLSVKKYAPPEYIIAVEAVTVPDADRGEFEISERIPYGFLYNYSQRKMYVIVDSKDDGYAWVYLDPNKQTSGTRVTTSIGEMAFYLTYKILFYGKRAGFGDSFYNKI